MMLSKLFVIQIGAGLILTLFIILFYKKVSKNERQLI